MVAELPLFNSLHRGKAGLDLLSSVSRHYFHVRKANESGIPGPEYLANSAGLVNLFVSLGMEQVYLSGMKFY